jgi:glycosyltransferase involved in cell wall biosynthesis
MLKTIASDPDRNDNLISVIIPTFNRRTKVVRAIKSVLGQTHNHIEIIVVDDGSTDGTVEYLRKYFQNRIQCLCLPHSGHPNSARNRGIESAKGMYIAFLDSDDWYLPEKLEKQIQFLQTHPQYDVAYCDMKVVDDKGQLVADSWFQNKNRMQQGDIFKFNLFLHDRDNRGFELYLNWLLIPRSVFAEIGLLCEKFDFLEDWEFTLRLTSRYSFGCVKQSLVVAERRSGDNYSQKFCRQYANNPATFAVPVLQYLKQDKLRSRKTLLLKAIRHSYLLSTKRELTSGSLKNGWTSWLCFGRTLPDPIHFFSSVIMMMKSLIKRYTR